MDMLELRGADIEMQTIRAMLRRAILVLLAIGISRPAMAAAEDLPTQPPTLTTEGIMAFLPMGAGGHKTFLGTPDLPKKVVAPAGNAAKSQSPAIIYADLDGDGQDEVAVAYNYEEAKGEDRAMVRILDWDGKAYKVQWESPEFGYAFEGDFHFLGPQGLQYSENAFAVRDLNGDGRLDLLFTRGSWSAEGCLFEAWTWADHDYRMLVEVPRYVRLVQETGSGKFQIVGDRKPYVVANESNEVFVYRLEGGDFKRADVNPAGK